MPTSSRYLTGLALLIVGCAVGCGRKNAGEPTDADHTYKKGIRAIVVGPKPDQLNYPNVQIAKSDDEVAFWIAKKKTDNLRIEFDAEIFEGMTQVNGKWVPKDCGTSRICYSGNIKDSVVPSDHEYKYGQVLIDKDGEHSADGHMIINP